MTDTLLTFAGAMAAVLAGWLGGRTAGTRDASAGWRVRAVLLAAGPAAAALAILCGAPLLLSTAIGVAVPLALSAAWLDWQAGVIADMQSAGLVLAGLVAAPFLYPYATWAIALGGGGVALAVLALGQLAVWLRSRKQGLGTGDYGLAAAGGVWCGLGWVGPALLIAVAVTVLMALIRGRADAARYAFAPGLVAGFSLATLAGRLI